MTDMLNLEKIKFVYQNLRDTQIRSVHEMGDVKRAQELRVDEFSGHKMEGKS